MSNIKLVILMCCAAALIGSVGCGSKDSSSDSTPSNYTLTLLDSDVVWAVNGGIDQIYNDNLAGQPVSNSHNISAMCPLGGFVVITGATGYTINTGITTVSLTYAMSGCKITKTSSSGTSVSLTLTGSVAHVGSFNSSTNFKSVNYQSSSLTMTGTAHRTGYNDATVNNANCSYSGASTSSGTSSTVSGSVCGNATVSWTN